MWANTMTSKTQSQPIGGHQLQEDALQSQHNEGKVVLLWDMLKVGIK
jgi:hypothetical protein